MQVNHKLFLIPMKYVICLNAVTSIHFKKNSAMNYY